MCFNGSTCFFWGESEPRCSLYLDISNYLIFSVYNCYRSVYYFLFFSLFNLIINYIIIHTLKKYKLRYNTTVTRLKKNPSRSPFARCTFCWISLRRNEQTNKRTKLSKPLFRIRKLHSLSFVVMRNTAVWVRTRKTTSCLLPPFFSLLFPIFSFGGLLPNFAPGERFRGNAKTWNVVTHERYRAIRL